MARRLSKQVPRWFNFKDYKIAKEFDDHDWAKMLRCRRSWFDAWGEGFLKGVPEAEELWDGYLTEALPSRLNRQRPQAQSDPYPPSYEQSYVLDITDAFPSRRFRTRYKWNIDFGSRMLLVDPHASDAILLEKFSRWLIDQREKANTARRRGRKAANFAITPKLLKAWAAQKLLPVWDLDFYAKVFGKSKLTPKTLCDAVDVDVNKDPKEWARATRSKAGELLKNIEYLPR
jgi:hypothetical protein